ncbi:EF-hand domain-containing protein [Pseudaestuariivita sp.]|uniref:EF-hand domain-containing protein n=1 Tax=Pseudaestuariivita sp. TaxID=2211669 RepID=UPI0040583034
MTKFGTHYLAIALLGGASLTLAAGDLAAKEPRAQVAPAFEELDADADGSVTAAELEAFGAARWAARFAAIDTDGNGAVSAEELAAAADKRAAVRSARHAARMIERLDADGDGALSLAELAERGGSDRRGGDRAERLLSRADTDGSGALSEAEYSAALDKMKARRDGGPRHKGPRADRG